MLLSLIPPCTTRAEAQEPMAQVSGLNDFVSVKSEIEIHDEFGVDELDHIPLKERLEMLRESKIESGTGVIERESKRHKMSERPIDLAIEKELECPLQDVVLDYPGLCFSVEGKDGRFLQEHCHADRILDRSAVVIPKNANNVHSDTVPLGSQNTSICQYEDMPGDCNRPGTHINKSIYSSQITYSDVKSDVGLEKVDVNGQNLPQHPTLSTFPTRVKVEYSDNDLINPCRDNKNVSAHAVVEACIAKNEIHDEIETDELDHIPLKERHVMLLSRRSIVPSKQIHISGLLEGVAVGKSAYLMDDINQHSARKVEEESHSVDKQYSIDGNDSHGIPNTNASEFFGTSAFNSSSSDIAAISCIIPQCSPKASNFPESVSPKPSIFWGIQQTDGRCSTQMSSTEFESPGEQEFMPANPNNILGSSLPTFLLKVKVEGLENGLESPCNNALGMFTKKNMLPVKGEVGISDKFYEDELDHMPLQQRIMLLMSRKDFNVDCSKNLKCLRRTVPLSIDRDLTVSEKAKPRGINCRRKRKKTATDSVETALEEDAPGLLQVLIDKGITVNEIRLYGDMENEDALDISSNGDGFVDLENVISKLFSSRASLLKFAPVRCTKGLKPSYCLACLISLVEQTRYLLFRKWPVQWGWCRDLHSFIFVFEGHNRIVLERPEYGYATYFFELVDSLPIAWQIKRLVIAMKLSSNSRANLIENRSLLVGEDLTEGEAKVLVEYGWTPNSGLGSMLNYCDRVIHDKQNENDGSEWRSKIGKLLVNGYNGGTIILRDLPKKFIEYKNT